MEIKLKPKNKLKATRFSEQFVQHSYDKKIQKNIYGEDDDRATSKPNANIANTYVVIASHIKLVYIK